VSRLPRPIVAVARLAIAALALPALLAIALRARRDSAQRRRAGLRPRVVWGPEPLINLKYWSAGLRSVGLDSATLVRDAYVINSRADFDRVIADFGPPPGLFAPFREPLAFAWALRHADVFVTSFSGGFLSATRLRDLEARLLRLAGKKLVVFPYGSDIAVAGHLGPIEQAMAVDYPGLIAAAGDIRARVDWFCDNADVVVRTLQPGYLPRHDVLWPSVLAIDTDRFAPPAAERGRGDGRNGEVVVVHAPNHRELKGTAEVIAAVEALRGEGLDVRLELLERRPNDEVRAALRRGDVLVDQLLCGFGMFAVEGLACGIPVVSCLRWMAPELLEHPSIATSPIVDAATDDVVDRLRELVTDPARRLALGRAGRDYVLRWNSYGSIGRTWAAIVEAAWDGRPAATVIDAAG
jgi:glycosyltransferase involved in cell wall biosynthesis